MPPRAVTDSLSNREEHIVELATRIGSGRKRDIFAAVYHGKKSIKTVTEIATRLGLTEKQVLDAGKPLVDAHVIDQTKVGGKTAYGKIEYHKAIKEKVLSLCGNPEKISKIPTKRNPRVAEELFRTRRSRKPEKGKVDSRRKKSSKLTTVAFLTASPVNESALEVGVEARQIETERKKSARRDEFKICLFPGANVDSLLEAINEANASILHFAGHGSSGEIVLDRETIGAPDNKTVSSSVLGKILSSSSRKPRLVFLNACESAAEVHELTNAVDHVIATLQSIPDAMALEFSRRFYSALFSGLSVKRAFGQAAAVVELDYDDVEDVVQLFSADGKNADDLVF